MVTVLNTTTAAELQQLAEQTFEQMQGRVIMGAPIGIGKASHLLNAFYRVAQQNPHYQLDIHTALTLARPHCQSDLEARLLEPFFERQFARVEPLLYADAARRKCLPDNIRVIQFYFKPGEMLNNPAAQCAALSVNYTQVAQAMMARGVNVLTQAISQRQQGQKMRYSLASNPDVTLDLQRLMRTASAHDNHPRVVIAEINSALPFMLNDAEVPAEFFDTIVAHGALKSPLFAVPQQAISDADHLIGLYASALIKDGGTLQIGIGSLGDAICNALLVRQKQNPIYQQLLHQLAAVTKFPVIKHEGGTDTLQAGLYGNTEMLVPGYLALQKGGVLKRRVYDNLAIQQCLNNGLRANVIELAWFDALLTRGAIHSPLTAADCEFLKYWGLLKAQINFVEGQLVWHNESFVPDLGNAQFRRWLDTCLCGQALNHGTLMHAGFFVGNDHFYQTLQTLPEPERQAINMTSVSRTNQLAEAPALYSAQRRHARFFNACMKSTLSGAAVSDALENGQMVSGVGGQFNFVAMAHQLPDARSVLMMRATRQQGRKILSNIVFSYGHVTIPRHLRDIVITEYGVADLRHKTDEEVIIELLKVTDSRFQEGLINEAQNAGKLAEDFFLPKAFQHNRPEQLAKALAPYRETAFSSFPFGSELSEQERLLARALKTLQRQQYKPWQWLKPLLLPIDKKRLAAQQKPLQRLGLDKPKTLKDHLLLRLLIHLLPEPAATQSSHSRRSATAPTTTILTTK